MTAKEIFDKLGYKTHPYFQKDHTITYIKYETDEFYEWRIVCAITFNKRLKSVDIEGNLSSEDFQAINKQIEELGWE